MKRRKDHRYTHGPNIENRCMGMYGDVWECMGIREHYMDQYPVKRILLPVLIRSLFYLTRTPTYEGILQP